MKTGMNPWAKIRGSDPATRAQIIEKIGKHPEIGAAISKLEMVLNVLTIETGALL